MTTRKVVKLTHCLLRNWRTWTSFIAYLLFGILLPRDGPASQGLALIAILVFINCTAYTRGLNDGKDIVRKVRAQI